MGSDWELGDKIMVKNMSGEKIDTEFMGTEAIEIDETRRGGREVTRWREVNIEVVEEGGDEKLFRKGGLERKVRKRRDDKTEEEIRKEAPGSDGKKRKEN